MRALQCDMPGGFFHDRRGRRRRRRPWRTARSVRSDRSERRLIAGLMLNRKLTQLSEVDQSEECKKLIRELLYSFVMNSVAYK